MSKAQREGASAPTPIPSRLREAEPHVAAPRNSAVTGVIETERVETRPYDAFIHAELARITQGISPIAVALAYVDWLSHLSASPSKQHELIQKAVRKWTRLMLYMLTLSTNGHCCIEPLPQDKRFDHPEWQRWPFNLIYQSFLLTQQWWWNATTDVRGVTRHHEQVISFMARQWLDMFSPSNYLLTNPEVLQHTVKSVGTNLFQGLLNLLEDMLRLAANRPVAGTDRFKVGVDVAMSSGKVIFRNRLFELIQYEPLTDKVRPEPVLITPSWIMKYYILDLSTHNSLVRYLLESGYTVFMISWKNPEAEDRDFGLDTYLREGVLAALNAVSKVRPGQRVHALGYCLGGTLLAIAASTLAHEGDQRLASMTLLASELDFSEPGELGLFIDESQIAFLEDIMWMRGYLNGKEMAGTFALLNSKDLVWSKMVHDYLMGQRDRLTDLMCWNADATRMPYRMHSEYLRKLYLGNELAEGKFEVDGHALALTDIRAPIFAVSTERDHVSPWKSVYKVHLHTDTEVTFVLSTGGHNVGVVNPPGNNPVPRGYRIATHGADEKYVDPDLWLHRTAQHSGSWWPAWRQWLDDRSGAFSEPPAMGAANAGLPPLDDAPGQYVLQR
ncbi:MAG: alpha/beta fold hydrolase [Gammaproteobacteria bacterium]